MKQSIIKNLITYIILVGVIIFTFTLHLQLREIRINTKYTTGLYEITKDNIQEIKNIHKFLVENQNYADETAMYLVQPKTYKKTHRECVFSDDTCSNVFKDVYDVAEGKRIFVDITFNGYAKITKTSNHEMSSSLDSLLMEVCYVLPVYKHRILVAEIYLLYKTDPNFTSLEVEKHVMSYQMLASYIY